MNQKTRSGFTLPEVLLSTVLSAMVFVALGTLLTRSFSIWYSGMAQWKLATHARVTRIRLLDGGFGKGTGMLSATNYTMGTAHDYDTGSDFEYVQYYPAGRDKEYRAYGCISGSPGDDLWLRNHDPAVPVEWAYGQSVKFYDDSDDDSDVKVGDFDAEFVGDNMLEMTYTLHLSAGGKTFEQPQTIRAVLLNSE